jgi:hypothetical protein
MQQPMMGGLLDRAARCVFLGGGDKRSALVLRRHLWSPMPD